VYTDTAAGCFISVIFGTSIIIIAANGFIDASSGRITIFLCTCIVVITINILVFTTSGRITIVSGTEIIIVTTLVSVITTFVRITRVVSTRINETAYRKISTADSWIAIINLTLVTSLTCVTDIGKDTSLSFITGVVGTYVVIITLDRRILATINRATRIIGTFRSIIAALWCINTAAGCFISVIFGTSIIIIARR
jgi:hypothetical protein